MRTSALEKNAVDTQLKHVAEKDVTKSSVSEKSSPSLVLRAALSEDIPFCARALAAVCEGVLDAGLAPLRERLGLASLEELFSAALYEGSSSLLNLRHMTVLSADGYFAGLLYAYVPSEGEELLPDFVSSLLDTDTRELISLLSGSLLPLRTGEKVFYVNTLYVAEGARGRRYGAALISLARTRARALGLDTLMLHCFAANCGALNFYAREGFTVREEIFYTGNAAARFPEGGRYLVKSLADGESATGSAMQKGERAC